MELPKNGQLYRFLDRWESTTDGWAAPHKINNLCQLWTRTAVLALWLTGWGVFAASFVLGTIQWIAVFFGGPMIFAFFAFIALPVWFVVAVVAAIIGVFVGLDKLKDSTTSSSPGIIRETYRGWKDKYCPTVTWVDEDE